MIRNYNNPDYPSILELLALNTPDYFHPEEKAGLVYYLNNHSDNYFVLVSDNKILACGGYNYAEEAGIVNISWDIVHPQYQGKGFGSRLLKYRIDQVSQDKNVKIISVRTSQHAYRFYSNHGFKLTEIVKDYWAPGFDLYSMKFTI